MADIGSLVVKLAAETADFREDLGKTWFTILDFKRATDNFADPKFDGEPVQIYEPTPDQPVAPPEQPGDTPFPSNPPSGTPAGEDGGIFAPRQWQWRH